MKKSEKNSTVQIPESISAQYIKMICWAVLFAVVFIVFAMLVKDWKAAVIGLAFGTGYILYAQWWLTRIKKNGFDYLDATCISSKRNIHGSPVTLTASWLYTFRSDKQQCIIKARNALLLVKGQKYRIYFPKGKIKPEQNMLITFDYLGYEPLFPEDEKPSGEEEGKDSKSK